MVLLNFFFFCCSTPCFFLLNNGSSTSNNKVIMIFFLAEHKTKVQLKKEKKFGDAGSMMIRIISKNNLRKTKSM
jgi:hypothetical protein